MVFYGDSTNKTDCEKYIETQKLVSRILFLTGFA